MEGSCEPIECADVGTRADCGVFGIEFRGGESSVFSNVCTASPLLAELSAYTSQLSYLDIRSNIQIRAWHLVVSKRIFAASFCDFIFLDPLVQTCAEENE